MVHQGREGTEGKGRRGRDGAGQCSGFPQRGGGRVGRNRERGESPNPRNGNPPIGVRTGLRTLCRSYFIQHPDGGGRTEGRGQGGQRVTGGEASVPLGCEQEREQQVGTGSSSTLVGEGHTRGGAVAGQVGERMVNPREVHRYVSLMAAVERHKVTLVGVQEHHWHDPQEVEGVGGYLARKGWEVEATWGPGREGVALLWRKSEWRQREAWALERRLLVVQMEHVSGDVVNVLVGHFQVEPGERQRQWRKVGEWVARQGLEVHVVLGDHNSVVHGGQTTRWREGMSSVEWQAIEEENACLVQLGALDAWEVVHGEEVENGGYTHTYHREGRVIERRIDRVHVNQGLATMVTSAYVIPIGFSDHMGVVCWIQASSHWQEKGRWKFNTMVLNDASAVMTIQRELAQVTRRSFEGWEEGVQVLRRYSMAFSAKASQQSALWREAVGALQESTRQYVTRRGWQVLARAGVRVDSMEKAYGELQKVVVKEERELQARMMWESVREVVHTEEEAKEARRFRLKAIHRMLRELRGQRSLVVVKDKVGRVVKDTLGIAEALREFWAGVTPKQSPRDRGMQGMAEEVEDPTAMGHPAADVDQAKDKRSVGGELAENGRDGIPRGGRSDGEMLSSVQGLLRGEDGGGVSRAGEGREAAPGVDPRVGEADPEEGRGDPSAGHEAHCIAAMQDQVVDDNHLGAGGGCLWTVGAGGAEGLCEGKVYGGPSHLGGGHMGFPLGAGDGRCMGGHRLFKGI